MGQPGIDLLRPACKKRDTLARVRFRKPLWQIIESINDTLKASLTWSNTEDAAQRSLPSAAFNASWP